MSVVFCKGKEGRERYNAYRDAMEEHGIPVCDNQIYTAIITGRVAGKLWSSL